MVIFEVILLGYLLFCFAKFLVKGIPVVLILPVAPFLCAKELKDERPVLAWSIIVTWASLYFIACLALFINTCVV